MAKRFVLLLFIHHYLCLTYGKTYQVLYMEEYCNQLTPTTVIISASGPNSRGTIKGTRNQNYPTGKMCNLVLQPPEGHGIVVSLDDISLRSGPHHICIDFLELKIWEKKEWEDIVKACSVYPISSYQTDGSLLLRFYSNRSCCTFGAGFSITFTTYQIPPCERSDSFECANGNCIWEKLVCDFRNNCGDNSDEWLYEKSKCAHSETTKIIVPVVCSIIGVIIIVAICVCFCRRRRQKVAKRSMSTATYQEVNPTAPSASDQLSASAPFSQKQPQDYGSTREDKALLYPPPPHRITEEGRPPPYTP